MSDISIRRAHALNHKQARQAADKMAKKLEEAFDMEFEWDGDTLNFRRSGVDGELTLHDKEVQIDVRLGFLLAMMRPKIEASIMENLDKAFSETRTPAAKKKAAPRKK